jgi:hypothetical protein
MRDQIARMIDNELSGFGSYSVALGLADRILELTAEVRGALNELLAVVESRTPDQLGLHAWKAVQLRDRCRNALAAGTQSAETSETSAPSEGCQSGPKGNAQ